MACGFGPQMFEIIDKMKNEEDKKTLERTQVIENKIKEQAEIQPKEEAAGDWTAAYKKWEKWEDLEELEEKAKVEREKQERMGQGRTSCSHDHSAERKIAEMSTADQVASMEKFRGMGNLFFEEGQYTRAALNYKRTLIYYDYCFPEDDVTQAKVDELRLTALLNSAACFLHTGETHEALSNCSQALAMDPLNCKALYRKAQALRMQDRFSEAKECLKQALQLQPTDPHLRRELELLKGKIAGYKNRSREMGKRVFSFQQQSNQTGNINRARKHLVDPLLYPSRLPLHNDGSSTSIDDLYTPLQFDGWEKLKQISFSSSNQLQTTIESI